LRVKLLYFAIVREMIGHSEAIRELPEGITLNHLFDQIAAENPGLQRLRPSILFMVNQEYARPDRTLRDGDEVAFIPPVSGGEDARFRVTDAPISVEDVVRLVTTPESGAVASFLGTVRNNARDRTVTLLEYEAYPPAAKRMLQQIGDEIQARWGIERVAIVHRFGQLSVGEASVAIAVAAPHRGDAFDACRYAIDRIKEIVPIWKKEYYEDGETWIGSEAEYQAAFGTSSRAPIGNDQS
jgi:MoaE-MoaD fusion protein